MAGPQVQHTQRPNSAYYTGLNGSGGSAGGGGGSASGAGGMASSASHTGLGLHALRQVSNETELIYRGSHSNGTVNELPGSGSGSGGGGGGGQAGRQLPSSHMGQHGRIIQHQPAHSSRENVVSSIAGTGNLATDALIGTIATSTGAGSSSSALAAFNSGGGGGGGGGVGGVGGTAAGTAGVVLKKSSTQRSIEIIVDATQCGKEAADVDDVEQGDGGQESSSSLRKSSRHRHRPLHRRLISYLRNLFQGSDAQNALIELLVAWGCISKRKRFVSLAHALPPRLINPICATATN
ncbi:putative lysozyme-like protein, partial [Drosophila navojoa]